MPTRLILAWALIAVCLLIAAALILRVVLCNRRKRMERHHIHVGIEK